MAATRVHPQYQKHRDTISFHISVGGGISPGSVYPSIALPHPGKVTAVFATVDTGQLNMDVNILDGTTGTPTTLGQYNGVTVNTTVTGVTQTTNNTFEAADRVEVKINSITSGTPTNLMVTIHSEANS
jgi:hypothetical protein